MSKQNGNTILKIVNIEEYRNWKLTVIFYHSVHYIK